MKYLIDTNHWSYLQEGQPAVVARFRALPEDATVFMSVVSEAELLAGIELVESRERREELASLYREVLTEVTDVLPVTSEIAQHFARIFASLRRRGRPIETNDIWLAATAQAHDLVVVSNDTHFQEIEGLILENWTT